MIRKLTPRQDRFCREYVIDQNGAQAALRAGYSKKAANVRACEMLNFPHIQERIAVLQKKVNDKLEVSAARIVQELATIAFVDQTDLGKVVKCSDKINALELLGKHLKMFTDKVEWLGDDSFVKLLEAARGRVKS